MNSNPSRPFVVLPRMNHWPVLCVVIALSGGMWSMNGCGGRAGGVDLWDAVEREDLDAMERYAAKGGNVNVIGWNKDFPLFYAIENNKRESYRKLLELGADPNITTRGGGLIQNVLFRSVYNMKDSYWLRLALEHGGNPNAINPRSKDNYLLHQPHAFSSLEKVKLLVEHGADINIKDKDGLPPLNMAMYMGCFDVVLYLLDQGADINAKLPREPSNEFLNRVRLGQIMCAIDPDERDEGFLKVRTWLDNHGIEWRQ